MSKIHLNTVVEYDLAIKLSDPSYRFKWEARRGLWLLSKLREHIERHIAHASKARYHFGLELLMDEIEKNEVARLEEAAGRL